jgi:hypothetical protein
MVFLFPQSLSVQQASFRCGWYTRTPRFKRILLLLIMRSQKPVKFNAGKFFVVSLETFSDVKYTHSSFSVMEANTFDYS